MDDQDPKSILDFGAWLDIDAPTVARPVVHPLTWHDVTIYRTNDHITEDAKFGQMCGWRAPKCDVCCGTERVFYEKDQPCECRGIKARMDRLNLARIPWDYAHAKVTDLKDGGREYVRDYKDGAEGLRFGGTTGTGKTHRMICTVLGLCERGITARYVSWALWLDDMRAAFGRDDEVAAVRARVERPQVVALDDIGRERDTDWAQSMLDNLLERRTLRGGTVLLASNLTDQGLEHHLGDRLWSRLRSRTRPIALTGKDWRASK